MAGLLIGVCVVGVVLAFMNIEVFRTVELKIYDWWLIRIVVPFIARQDIAFVEIDEYSLRNLQQYVGRWLWSRVVHASVIEYLSCGKSVSIVYDVLFADEDFRVGFLYGGEIWFGAESDQVLADTIKKVGVVILAVDAI